MTKDINIYKYKEDRYCIYSYTRETSRLVYKDFENIGLVIDRHDVIVLDSNGKIFSDRKYPYYKIKVLKTDDEYQQKDIIIDIPKMWVDTICKSKQELMLELL